MAPHSSPSRFGLIQALKRLCMTEPPQLFSVIASGKTGGLRYSTHPVGLGGDPTSGAAGATTATPGKGGGVSTQFHRPPSQLVEWPKWPNKEAIALGKKHVEGPSSYKL